MAIQGYQSSKRIISKVFRDLKIQDTDWVSDSVEWMGEALQGTGSVTQLENKIKIVKTSSHKAVLPEGLYRLDEVRYGYFNANREGDNPPKKEDFPKLMTYENTGYHPSMIDSYNSQKQAKTYCEETFFVQGNYIHTSFEEDWIAVVYKGIATDCDGFPHVPDHYSFSQALYWYIVMKMLESGMEHPAGKQQITWAVAEDRWQHYCSQAKTKALMPDPVRYQEFAKNWVTLIPNVLENSQSVFDDRTEEPSTLAGMAYQPVKD